VQLSHLSGLFCKLGSHFFVIFEVSLAVLPILLELLLQNQVFPQNALLLIFCQNQSHFNLFKFSPEAALFCAFLCPKARHSVCWVSLAFEQLYVGLFFSNDSLDGLVLHLVVLPGAEGVRVFHSLLGALFGLGRGEAVDQEGDPAIDLRGFQVGELTGSRPCGLQSEGDCH